CNVLRSNWAEALSVDEARLTLSPVEGMSHEGFISKRIHEEGGGYRFTFQKVAEYLIYRYLAAAAPATDELAYWSKKASHPKVFAEYAGAFAFLFRDWAAANKLQQIGLLIESSTTWLARVLAEFLVEQATTGFVPGQGSPAAVAAAKALIQTGGRLS